MVVVHLLGAAAKEAPGAQMSARCARTRASEREGDTIRYEHPSFRPCPRSPPLGRGAARQRIRLQSPSSVRRRPFKRPSPGHVTRDDSTRRQRPHGLARRLVRIIRYAAGRVRTLDEVDRDDVSDRGEGRAARASAASKRVAGHHHGGRGLEAAGAAAGAAARAGRAPLRRRCPAGAALLALGDGVADGGDDNAHANHDGNDRPDRRGARVRSPGAAGAGAEVSRAVAARG